MSSDSVILVLRRFISIRGPVSCIRCDQGTNFVFQMSFKRPFKIIMEQGSVIKLIFLSLNRQIEFVFNPPSASHFGGVFERQIGTIQKVLSGFLFESNRFVLTDEC